MPFRNLFRRRRRITRSASRDLASFHWRQIRDLVDRHTKVYRQLSLPFSKRKAIYQKGRRLRKKESGEELIKRLGVIEEEILHNVLTLSNEGGHYREKPEELLSDLTGIFPANPERVELQNSVVNSGSVILSDPAKRIYRKFLKEMKNS